MVRFALKHYLGVVERDPGPLPYDEARAREIAGSYENDAMTLTIATDGTQLTIAAGIKPEIRAASDTELPRIFRPLPSACCRETRMSTSSAAGA